MKPGQSKSKSSGRYSLIHTLIQIPFFVTALVGALTFFIAAALFSFNPYDQSWLYFSTDPLPITNYAGSLGASVSAGLLYLFGSSAYILCPFGFYAMYCAWNGFGFRQEGDRWIAAASFLVTLSAFLHVYHIGGTAFLLPGGVVGQQGFLFVRHYLDFVGALLCMYTLLAIELVLLSRLSFMQVYNALKHSLCFMVRTRRHWFTPIVKLIKKSCMLVYALCVMVKNGLVRMVTGQDIQEYNQSVVGAHTYESDPFDQAFWQQQGQQPVHVIPQGAGSMAEDVATSSPAKIKKNKAYQLPAPSLFAQHDKEDFLTKSDTSKQTAATLEEKLSRFGIVGSVVAIKKGPVVTLFEYQPAIETKLSKIIPLEQDLALALEAMSVRIIAPLPGTSRVGFEVSNKERCNVRMGGIIRASSYQKSTAILPLILGQDTTGADVVVDLVDMPHLLVAGSTGSGKSIALNTMLISLLCRLSPQQLKLIIIDPKRLEFATYKDIPHLLFPIITDAHRAAPVIRWLVKVMEERYQLMAAQGVRNIFDYKKMCKEQNTQDALPFIVFIIDELADLMMVAGKDVEEGIARLAQMARASGIHLIVATQRPSVDVVTGVIKVNFPSRISFRLTSKIDSRTILDSSGAESLLGKGDMLFMDAHSARIKRVHGAYVSDAEIKKVVDAIKEQQTVEYIDLDEAVASYKANQDQQEEPILPEVMQFLKTVDEVSISLLQRRFKIGYNRSARLIELLEMQGKVMPADGSKLRKVIH